MPTPQETQLAWRVLNWIQANGNVPSEDASALRRASLGNRLRPLDEIAREIIESSGTGEDLAASNR